MAHGELVGTTEVTMRLGRAALTLRMVEGRCETEIVGPVAQYRVRRAAAAFECIVEDVPGVRGRDIVEAIEVLDRLTDLRLPRGCTEPLLAAAAVHDRWEVRLAAATHRRTPVATLARLRADVDRVVAGAAGRRYAAACA